MYVLILPMEQSVCDDIPQLKCYGQYTMFASNDFITLNLNSGDAVEP